MKISSLIKRIVEYEKHFSCNDYNGCGAKEIIIKEGTIPVMISAPHSINQVRDGKLKPADMFTGGIANYLHKVTGCHIICSAKYNGKDPNYDSNKENIYQKRLKKYFETHKVNILIDLHGLSDERDCAIDIGTIDEQDTSLQGKTFICELIYYIFQYFFKGIKQPQKKKRITKNQIFDAGNQNTITKYISENTNVSCIQLEINKIYRTPHNRKEFYRLIQGLSCLINILGKFDWDSNGYVTFNL